MGQANLDVGTAAAMLGGKPRQRSIERLIAGHPIRLYDGSMDDWGKRNLPTEGARP